jgi:SAM-dependent methyltransferase
VTAPASLTKKFAELPAKISTRLRHRGILDVAGWCYYQCSWRLRDWRLGARTNEYDHGVVVGDDGECNGYEPIDYRCFDNVLDYLQPITDDDVFLDYGCGMGRAVIMAATMPFGRVLGVEIDHHLAKIAREQIERVQRRGKLACQNVEIVEADAAQWEIPTDVNRIFLFNSFTGDLLNATLRQVYRSAAAKPRDLKIIYIQPIGDHDPLSELSWLRQEAELPTGYWMHVRSRVYQVQSDNVGTPGVTNVDHA